MNPKVFKIKEDKLFSGKEFDITFYSKLTIFVGANASGKTQTLKALRDVCRAEFGDEKVRYLSSNRIGTMESYRSKTSRAYNNPDDYVTGDTYDKKVCKTFETSKGDFLNLDARKDIYIKVAERLSVLFNREIFINWNEGRMKVYFSKKEGKEYSASLEASGLINIVSILSSLYDDTTKVLLIDEPEVSLHPQLQSYLLNEINEICKKNDKYIVLATHSANMIEINSPVDISNFVFFEDSKLPRQIESTSPNLNDKKIKDFILKLGIVYKEAFFAKKVLLVEGPSDYIICRYLSNRLNLNLGVAGTQIVPIDGKGQFPNAIKLFRLIGKEVIVLTDLDGFVDDNNIIDLFACLPNGLKLPTIDLINKTKSSIATIIEKNKTSLLPICKGHPYCKNKDESLETNKILKRAMVGQMFCESDDSLMKWPNSEGVLKIKKDLIIVFDELDKLGCHILRKGSIECYFASCENKISCNKTSMANEEAFKLENKESSAVIKEYKDVISALEGASLSKKIDESLPIKEALSVELSLIINVLSNSDKTTENDLYLKIKKHIGSDKSMFKYTKIYESGKLGVYIDLNTKVLNVGGFPFKVFVGDNLNQIINMNVKSE